MKKFILAAISTLLFCGISLAQYAPTPAPTQAPAVTVPTVETGAKPKTPEERRAMIKQMHDELKLKREAMYVKVKAACSADIATAGCDGKEKAQLMQCIRLHKQKNNDFKLNENCRLAMGERQDERQELKRQKREMKKNMRGNMKPNGPIPTVPPEATLSPAPETK